MRRRGFTKWELLVVLAGMVIIALFLLPALLKPTPAYRSSCQSNLKQIGLGFAQYIQDYDEKYPLINSNDAAISAETPLGWADSIQIYKISNRLFWCPTQIENNARNNVGRNPSDRDYTDYFYNRRLAGIEEKKIKAPSLTVLLGEGNDGTDAANARYSLSTLPAAWIADKSSPIYRHLEGANYAFADGHVKWMRPDKITGKKPDGKTFTFAVQ